jgi:ubiquinone/menaquinone biosynthesis C-methylase UbiE
VGITQSLLMRLFGRPQGALGRLGGIIMARANYDCGAWAIELLEVRPNDRVLEVGSGSGVIIQRVAAVAACVVCVDLSQEMVEQARARNAGAVLNRRVELRRGSVDSLPYERNTFDAALTINSFQVWQNAVAGLREIHGVMKPGGRVALGFTPYSGQSKKGLMEMLAIADFTSVQIVN